MGLEVHHVDEPAHAHSSGAQPVPGDEPRRYSSIAALVDPGTWEALIAGREVVRVPAGTRIYEAGQPPPVVAILSGAARVFIWAAGSRQLTCRYAGPGEVIGLGPSLAGVEISSAEAVTDTTAAILSAEQVRQLAIRDPELSWAIAQQVGRWASDVVRAVADAAHRPMTARVASHLLEVSLTTTGGDAARTTHQRLADAVGTAREVITRTLAVLRRAGVVETSPGRVVISDARRLALIARGELCVGDTARP
jgi:CRP/FNR family transcriptional regulator